MAKKPEGKKTAAKKQPVKKPMPERIGANTRKRMAEERAQKAGTITRLARSVLRIVIVVAIAAVVGFAAFTCSPSVLVKVSETAKSGKKLSTNVRIVKCGKQTQKLLEHALDSLLGRDSLSFERDDILSVAAAIPEIEKVTVKKTRNRTGRGKITLIRVTEREPVALIHCGDVFLVDKKGIRFSARPGQYYDLPLLVIDGEISRDTVDLKAFNVIKKASRYLGNDFFRQISQIDISDDSMVNLFFKSGETEYVIGYDDIEGRLAHVKELRERLLGEHVKPVRVDMRYRSLAFSSAQ
jgi:hypothetical protein